MNRQKGISTLGSILLAAVAGLGAATVVMDWVIVDVQTPEPEAIHFTIPFPLVVADIADPDVALPAYADFLRQFK